MRTEVIINFDVVGFHQYKEAPDKVKFLKYPHRHLFNIQMGFNVVDLDREIEIFIQEDLVRNYLYETYGTSCKFGGMSCEMIAADLLNKFGAVWVKVLEDGKGGSIVYDS